MTPEKLHARAVEVELWRILTAESGPDWQVKATAARMAGGSAQPADAHEDPAPVVLGSADADADEPCPRCGAVLSAGPKASPHLDTTGQ